MRDELKAQYFLLSIRKVRLEARMGSGRDVNLMNMRERKEEEGRGEIITVVDNRRSRRARYR